MEQQTHSNRRKIGVLSKPFWQRNDHARKSRNWHKCFTSQAESKRVTLYTSWMVSVSSNFWGPTNSMAKILDILRTQKWQNFFLYMIKLNSIWKNRPYRSRTSFPGMFILKLEQVMKLDQLHKRDLKNSFLIYALIGTIFINCLLMFS